MERGRLKNQFVLTIALFLAAALTAGCNRGATGGGGAQQGAPAVDAQIDGVAWEPFVLKPGEYYKYEVFDHPVKKKGWMSLQVADKGGGKIELKWQGEREDGLTLSAETVETPDMMIVMSRPALITSPVATPFLAAVLPQWWERMAGFQMKPGASWSVVLDEMMPAGFSVQVEDYCTVGGHKGFTSRMVTGKVIVSESCISPRIPLPLQVRVNDAQNKPRYEARLLEYRPGKP